MRRRRHGNGDGSGTAVVKGLSGKVAIVTGASRGIGLGVAQRLVDEGAHVAMTARKAESLAEAAAELGEGKAIWFAGAADDQEHQDEVIEKTLAEYGRIDYLVNNTGINPVYGPMIEVDMAASEKIMGVNLLSALRWSQKIWNRSLKANGGAIVNVASVAGIRTSPGIGMYGASKAALIRLTQELAVELGPDVRVNSVAPAVVKTKFATALFEGREAEVAAKYPLKRLGAPEDIGAAVAFLLSDDASWITGQNLVVDGGITLSDGS